MKAGKIITVVELLQAHLNDAYQSDDAKLIITRDNVSLDGAQGDVLVSESSAHNCIKRLVENVKEVKELTGTKPAKNAKRK